MRFSASNIGSPRPLLPPVLISRLRPEYFESAARAGEVWRPTTGFSLDAEAPSVVWAYGEGKVAAAWFESPEVLRHHMNALGLADQALGQGAYNVGGLTPYELGLICEDCGPYLEDCGPGLEGGGF